MSVQVFPEMLGYQGFDLMYGLAIVECIIWWWYWEVVGAQWGLLEGYIIEGMHLGAVSYSGSSLFLPPPSSFSCLSRCESLAPPHTSPTMIFRPYTRNQVTLD